MRKIVAAVLVVFAIGAIFSGCEKTDYQHPLHRDN